MLGFFAFPQPMKFWLPWILATQMAAARVDFWDLAPIHYADTPATDAIAQLQKEIEEAPLESMPALDRLRLVLERLDVPESSQTLVFSKTSKQIGLIGPRNPRALYFSENAYVGYVPGGSIEVIVEDPVLGPVFYLIDAGGPLGLKIARDSSDCFSCHGTTRTRGVPGVLVRSVFPDADGHSIGRFGSETVITATPVSKRWGGYYVTGESAHPHFGNQTYDEDADPEPTEDDLSDLRGVIATEKYLRPTSDVVALMLLEHQCEVHNLINEATMRYRRAHFLALALNPETDPDAGQAGRVADSAAARLVDSLLFKNEADLGDGIEGDEVFQEEFVARFPRTDDGDSLADLRLYQRLFKNRCSFMIYSEAFAAMPPRVYRAVMDRLDQALSPDDEEIAPHLGARERKRIAAILKKTLPDESGRE